MKFSPNCPRKWEWLCEPWEGMQDAHFCGQDGWIPGHTDLINRSKRDFSAILPVLEVKHLFYPLGDQASPSPSQPAVGLLWSVWEHCGDVPAKHSLSACVCSVLLPQQAALWHFQLSAEIKWIASPQPLAPASDSSMSLAYGITHRWGGRNLYRIPW